MSVQPGDPWPTSATHGKIITPSDTVDLDVLTKGLWIGGLGDMKVTMAGGEVVKFTALPAGIYLPICVSRIWAADTSATQILALW